tara:strand:- start:768 stop:923 length:156 start_codon:yes stop_codon:yes gene_type:complete
VYATAAATQFGLMEQAFWFKPAAFAQTWTENLYVANEHQFKKERQRGRKVF